MIVWIHKMDKIDHKLLDNPAFYRVPIILLIIGIVISLFFWFVVLTDLKVYFDILQEAQEIVPWVVLAFGVSLSLLIAYIARTAIVERHHAKVVEAINLDLKQEIANKQQLIEYKEKIEKSLHQDQKLQAIGTLAGGIAHEFNNLLYAIVGYTELARDDAPKDSITHKNLGKVLDAAKRGQELIARILSFSRHQNQNQPFEITNIKGVIESALALLRPTIPASVVINSEHTKNLFVEGNSTQLQQVLINLINNAVDAMDGVGDISIEAKVLEPGESLAVENGINPSHPHCKLIISDTGTGMDIHTANRIFEPFFTTKDVGRGTGLGLAIVHSIIEAHNGKILVKSQLGHGTTFIILLPLSATNALGLHSNTDTI